MLNFRYVPILTSYPLNQVLLQLVLIELVVERDYPQNEPFVGQLLGQQLEFRIVGVNRMIIDMESSLQVTESRL